MSISLRCLYHHQLILQDASKDIYYTLKGCPLKIMRMIYAQYVEARDYLILKFLKNRKEEKL
jgi:hypothetical protein